VITNRKAKINKQKMNMNHHLKLPHLSQKIAL